MGPRLPYQRTAYSSARELGARRALQGALAVLSGGYGEVNLRQRLQASCVQDGAHLHVHSPRPEPEVKGARPRVRLGCFVLGQVHLSVHNILNANVDASTAFLSSVARRVTSCWTRGPTAASLIGPAIKCRSIRRGPHELHGYEWPDDQASVHIPFCDPATPGTPKTVSGQCPRPWAQPSPRRRITFGSIGSLSCAGRRQLRIQKRGGPRRGRLTCRPKTSQRHSTETRDPERQLVRGKRKHPS